MPVEVTALRVFLATPGGLETERKLFRKSVHEFNNEFMIRKQFVLKDEGFERVASSAGRPQGRINEHVNPCDYLVVILWDRWGSKPSSESLYTSGTQEEFATAVQCLADPRAPMRNIAIFFKGLESRQQSDPGPQLQKVLEFKTQLEKKQMIFYKIFDSEEDLKRELRTLFHSWIENFQQEKEPIELPLEDLLASPDDAGSSGLHEQPGALNTGNPIVQGEASDLLKRAREHEKAGRITDAEIAFAAAITTNDHESLLAYARFLRRVGRLDKSLEINDQALNLLNSRNLSASEVDVKRSDILANMGVIYRKRGDCEKSIDFLEKAIEYAERVYGESGRRAEAYALDNLGYTLQQAGKREQALDKFKAAHKLREHMGDELGIAKSAINIARYCHADGQLGPARKRVEDALAALSDADNEVRTQAAARSLLGDIMRTAGENEDAIDQYELALKLNEKVHHVEGMAIICGQLARLFIAIDDLDKASEYSGRCIENNRMVGNDTGMASAYQIRGKVEMAKKAYKQARDCFATAFSDFTKNNNHSAALHAKIAESRAFYKLDRLQAARSAASRARDLAKKINVDKRTQDELDDLDGLLG